MSSNRAKQIDDDSETVAGRRRGDMPLESIAEHRCEVDFEVRLTQASIR